ncbi:MAG: anhydro-N-acetylmuramic acid kinase [Deinococcota bacterium]
MTVHAHYAQYWQGRPVNILGLMSGTSLDGVDGVLVRLEHTSNTSSQSTDTLSWHVLARASLPYPDDLQAALHQALRINSITLADLSQVNARVGNHYAQLVKHVQAEHQVDAVCVSGQTLYHVPVVDETLGWHTPSTLQLGEPSRVSETCNVMTVANIRQTDMAAGGQGAPLVSFADALLYGHSSERRSIHNLGGISNLTYLPAGSNEDIFAFDTGPANCLIDDAMQQVTKQMFDEGGTFAATGTVDKDMLEQWMKHPYFAQHPPKTTGREVFALELFLGQLNKSIAPADLVATLTALSSQSIAQAYQDFVLPHGLDRVLVAGGGAYNLTLMQQLKERLPVPVQTFNELGWQAKDREALAFAVLGYYALLGKPNILPAATGAAYPVIAGSMYVPSRQS